MISLIILALLGVAASEPLFGHHGGHGQGHHDHHGDVKHEDGHGFGFQKRSTENIQSLARSIEDNQIEKRSADAKADPGYGGYGYGHGYGLGGHGYGLEGHGYGHSYGYSHGYGLGHGLGYGHGGHHY